MGTTFAPPQDALNKSGTVSYNHGKGEAESNASKRLRAAEEDAVRLGEAERLVEEAIRRHGGHEVSPTELQEITRDVLGAMRSDPVSPMTPRVAASEQTRMDRIKANLTEAHEEIRQHKPRDPIHRAIDGAIGLAESCRKELGDISQEWEEILDTISARQQVKAELRHHMSQVEPDSDETVDLSGDAKMVRHLKEVCGEHLPDLSKLTHKDLKRLHTAVGASISALQDQERKTSFKVTRLSNTESNWWDLVTALLARQNRTIEKIIDRLSR